MEFGRVNGHFNVPSGTGDDDNRQPSDKKMSEQRRFYNWVESLHRMYRSYKQGRQPGSLTDERVVLLVKQGFMFRNIS